MFHEETRHIEGDWNFVRDKIKGGAIITYHVNSDEQLTDSFSKAFTNSLCISEHDVFGSIVIHKPNTNPSARNAENAKRMIFEVE